ncbi:MAG: hypothetical protein K6A38_07800 [Lachnospiraceae bacterium]|nr:hypothetical protein [Lachnospiraceae bacterium]
MKRSKGGNIIFGLVTATLILFISLMVKGTVYSMERPSSKGVILDGYTQSLENDYRREVKEVLEKAGFRNAGIMLSVVVDSDAMRDYTLHINHRKLSDESENGTERREMLIHELEQIKAPLEDSTVSVVFSY